MFLPITHHNHIMRIVQHTKRKEFIYGSRRYAWLTYVRPDMNITLEDNQSYGLRSNQNFEIMSDDFIVIYNATWPNYVTDEYDDMRSLWEWNGYTISPDAIDPWHNKLLTTTFSSGVKITAEYLGDSHEIDSLSTLIWMTDYVEPTF